MKEREAVSGGGWAARDEPERRATGHCGRKRCCGISGMGGKDEQDQKPAHYKGLGYPLICILYIIWWKLHDASTGIDSE